MSSSFQRQRADLIRARRGKIYVPLGVKSRQVKPKMTLIKTKGHLHVLGTPE